MVPRLHTAARCLHTRRAAMTFRRSTLILALLALGTVGASIPACAPAAEAPETGESDGANDSALTGSLPVGTVLVATAGVNLRSGASTSAGVLDVVQSGDHVTVVASAPKNGFYDVRYGSEVGWSSGKYYKLASTGTGTGSTSASSSSSSGGGAGGAGSSSSSASSSSSSGGAVATMVATASVNLRSGPGTSFSILEVVPSGATVTLLSTAENNGFYNVEYQGESGWCSASYLEASSSGTSSGGATTWSCNGSYGTVPMADGQYYATEFGCYLNANGNAVQDPGDNCIPTCLSEAQSSGLCAGMSGPTCEEHVAWYAADAARFGCLARLRVTNPQNGKAVVVVALDYGPACSVEKTVSHAAIDLSYPADAHLFGGATGIVDKALVHVDVVDPSTPLGPVQ